MAKLDAQSSSLRTPFQKSEKCRQPNGITPPRAMPGPPVPRLQGHPAVNRTPCAATARPSRPPRAVR